jgi:hypothetical protein
VKPRQLVMGDAEHVIRRLPKDVREAMKKHGLILAGGFIRSIVAGEEVKDIDLFGQLTALQAAAHEIATARGVGKPHYTKNAITIVAAPRAPLQFITRWTYSPDAAGVNALLHELDFTVCQAAIWWDNRTGGHWRTMCSEAFYEDLAARRLVYTNPQREEEAGGSMMRVRKFLARGYNIQSVSLGAVMARVFSRVEKSDLTKHGDERGISRVVTGLLQEVDPLSIIDGVDATDDTEALEGVQ